MLIMLFSNRLKIRRFNSGDWKRLHEIILDKEASPYAIYDHEFPTDEKAAKELTIYFMNSKDFYAICIKSTGELIGYIALNYCNEHQRNLGYCLHSAHQGKGYASEACRTLLEHAFNHLNIEEVIAGTANENHPSCKLLLSLNFKKISESTHSFRKSSDGTPIEFTGGEYLLKKQDFKNTTS